MVVNIPRKFTGRPGSLRSEPGMVVNFPRKFTTLCNCLNEGDFVARAGMKTWDAELRVELHTDCAPSMHGIGGLCGAIA